MKFYVIQTIMGILGSVGFAVLFGILDRKLIGIALGGGAGWAVYLLCTANGQSMFVGLFVASLFIAAFSEVLARVLKAPVILLLVPMLIPEIPGGDLYYAETFYGFWKFCQQGSDGSRSDCFGDYPGFLYFQVYPEYSAAPGKKDLNE